ncbi:MAG: geranyl-CoA carboxylase alpha subunit [Hyphomicrobiales bacterium]|jgi:geranyl-CoA carboxylase alpha subunit|nr:geranyl-CoA carboxylase alpha subunit [Hyphomicrobiales bacterium]
MNLLIANRGEIARRIMRTARRMGIRTVAVYSDADRDALHVREADTAVRLGAAPPRDSYLNIAAIIDAAKRVGADAVHPGYGFLAENADFALAAIDAGFTWVGPPPDVIRRMGDKAEAKRIAEEAGVPTIAGGEATAETAKTVGYPLMIKAVAGGGGRGMRLVRAESELAAAFDAARSEAEHAFGNGRLLLERALANARHIEVQVFADQHGNVLHLGERDCSVQRRHQKLIEESPSPAVDAALREQMGAAAVALAKAVNYAGAGTIEFLLDADRQFYFMEMNTRLQVEHPVTEAITGIDLVEWQLRVAMGERFTRQQADIRFHGHAIEARLCAEDGNFLPQSGRMALWRPVDGVRTEHALESGTDVSPFYDSMIAKVIARGATRDEARERLARALDATVALGLATNKAFLAAVLRDEEFAARGVTTDFLSRFSAPPAKPDARTLGIAAMLLASSAGHGEWTSWSTNPGRAMQVRFGEDEVVLTCERGAYRASVRGEDTAPDADDRRVVHVIEPGAVHLARAGQSYSLENTTHAPPARRRAAASDGRLIAPMNGRVVAVNAKAGDTAESGKALVVLEAMKMEHALSVPARARIKAVHVAPGMQVAPGHLLVELEPAS